MIFKNVYLSYIICMMSVYDIYNIYLYFVVYSRYFPYLCGCTGVKVMFRGSPEICNPPETPCLSG